MKKWAVLGVGIGVLGIGLWSIRSNTLLKAETEKSASQNEVVNTKEQVTRALSERIQTLSAVSNEQGLSATPKVVQLAQNDVFPKAGTSTDELKQLVTNIVLPTSASGVSWEYVNEDGSFAEPNSESIGTQLIYLKITENATSSSIQVPVPVTVTDDTVSIEDGMAYTSRKLDIITASDVVGESAEERAATLKQKLGVKAWDVTTGEELPVVVSDLDGLNETAKIGIYQVTYSVTMTDKSERKILKNYTFLIDEIMGVESENLSASTRFNLNQELAGWTEVALNSKDGLVENPVNKSKMGFINRGLVPKYSGVGGNQGILIVDDTEANFIDLYGKLSAVPYVNGSLLYPERGSGVEVRRSSGVEYRSHTKEYYMMRMGEDDRKQLKEILIDTPNQIAYVYDYTISRNLNFSVKLSMYNTAETAREFGILEMIGLAYFSVDIPVYPLPDNAGFLLRQTDFGEDKRMSVKYKDSKGELLSDFNMYTVGGRSAIDNYPGRLPNLANTNAFLSDFSRPGLEIEDLSANLDKAIMNAQDASKKSDVASQFGARPRLIQPNKAMNVGLEIFAGDELPFMELEVDPEKFNIYQDDPIQNFETKYTLEKVPDTNSDKPTEGTLSVVYPNMEEKNEPFLAGPTTVTENKDFLAANGNITIPRSKFPDPDHLNDNQGTVKTYHTTMIGSYKAPEVEYSGLPSNEIDVKVNVYHLGGTPIAQVVKKDSAWTKTETSLIKDQVILPGHTADLKYVNPTQPVDTSKVGLQFAEVCMTDLDEPTRKTIIKVPVMVVDTKPPTTGLMIGANDFSSSKAELAGLSDEQLKAFILEKSEAVAWDIATGLSEGVDLTVSETTLTNLDADGPHTATLQAKKGSTVVTKTIQINFSAKLTVNFVDEAGEPLNAPYTDTKEVGEVVDLTEITAITGILTKLKAAYDMEQPDTEIIKIANGENSMTYRFKGKLMYVSLPESFDFKLNIASYKKIRVDDPKVVGLPLVVSDTRLNTPGWSIKVKLKEELLNEDGKTILKNAVRYKLGDKEEILNSQALKVVQNTKPGKYDVSQGWSAEGDGLKLEIPPGAVNALGKYHGEILFELSETP